MKWNMNIWIIYLGLSGVILSVVSPEKRQESCPQLCTCNGNRATCTSLNFSTRFGNDITNLKISSPSGPHKDLLHLSDNILNNLGITSLEQLIIENMKIIKIDPLAFSNVTMTQLIIRNSIVAKIPELLFTPVTNLNLIDISNSTLINFAEIRSDSVQEINLSGCNIEAVNPATFVNTPNLRYLNLAENKLTDFDHSFILDVEQLNLSRNRISKVNFNVLIEKMRRLVDLDLSFNPLTEVIGADVDLEKLNLKNCSLTNLEFLRNMEAIEDLDLSDNKITDLHNEDFSNLIELQTLNLAGNNINSLPDLFVNNVRLYKLNLDNNPIKILPVFRTKGRVNGLKYFSCSGCSLKELNGNTFQYSPSLVNINLSKNKLVNLPFMIFKNVANLDKIDLSNNELRELDYDLFTQNSNLKTVKLSKNPLKNLDSHMFRNNKVLKELDVNDCGLTKLWDVKSTVRLPSLTELYAKNNKITVIGINELEITPNLKTFKLDGNPLNCDSNLEDLYFWISNRRVRSLKVKDDLNYDDDISLNDYPNFGWLQDCDMQMLDAPSEEEVDIELTNNESNSDGVQRVNLIDSDYNDDDFKEAVDDVISVNEVRFNEKKDYNEVVSFLLPALVFVLTTLIVLIFAVTLILVVMHKRNKTPNMPQINIIPWSNPNKTKKHSGSVYRPLSEEKIPV